MNDLYHIVSQFKNWEKYFHLATFEAGWTVESFDIGRVYAIRCRAKFYYDGRFKKKILTSRKILQEAYRYSTHEDDFADAKEKELVQTLERQKAQILASQDYLANRLGHEPNSIQALVKQAEDCLMDMQNPLPTSTFLVNFLDHFKSFKSFKQG